MLKNNLKVYKADIPQWNLIRLYDSKHNVLGSVCERYSGLVFALWKIYVPQNEKYDEMMLSMTYRSGLLFLLVCSVVGIVLPCITENKHLKSETSKSIKFFFSFTNENPIMITFLVAVEAQDMLLLVLPNSYAYPPIQPLRMRTCGILRSI